MVTQELSDNVKAYFEATSVFVGCRVRAITLAGLPVEGVFFEAGLGSGFQPAVKDDDGHCWRVDLSTIEKL